MGHWDNPRQAPFAAAVGFVWAAAKSAGKFGAADSLCYCLRMNSKPLALAIVAVFAGVWVTDFLIHGVWLANAYKETMSLWRPEAEMRSHMGWLLLGQFLWAATFVLVWSKGFPATASLGGACLFGLTMGVFFQASTLVTYAVQPLPGHLALKWFVSNVAQGGLMGVIAFYVCRPKAP